MQLGKAAGYAKGFAVKGITDGVALAIVGDGTTAEGDMHDAMNAASVWNLPLITMVTDNGIAISTQPDEGRGIKDFEAYAKGSACATSRATAATSGTCSTRSYEAARYVRDEQRPVLLHVHHLPRFNGHSSAADMTFDLKQQDPLIAFGELAGEGRHPREGTLLQRKKGEGRDFFAHHELGPSWTTENEILKGMLDQVRTEPDPPIDVIRRTSTRRSPTHRDAERRDDEHQLRGRDPRGARADVEKKGGVIWGQDIARLGGVMQATAGSPEALPGSRVRHPAQRAADPRHGCGAGLHEGVIALPEMQFGDYALNTFHWLVHMGNL